MSKNNWRLIGGTFLVFLVGFFIVTSRTAAISGSWKYTLPSHDDYLYWSYAHGASMTPTAEGNPFYAGEEGKRHAVPYTTSTLIGLLAKLLHVHVLVFFPLWHILMPFVFWLTFYGCLVYFWRYPPIKSGVFLLIFLLATLLVRQTGHLNLYRFSRPGDALWLLAIWISYAMNVRDDSKKILWLTRLSAAACIWFNPFLPALGLVVNFCEMVWQGWRKNTQTAKRLLELLGISLTSTAVYFIFIAMNGQENNWVFVLFEKETMAVSGTGKSLLHHLGLEWFSVALFGIAAGCVYAVTSTLKSKLTILDRLLLMVLFVQLLFQNIHIFLPGQFQVAGHVYYFLQIELLAIIGWLHEKIPLLQKRPGFNVLALNLAAFFGALLVIILMHPYYTFLRFNFNPLIARDISRLSKDTGFFHLTILPALVLLVGSYHYFGRFRQALHKSVMATALIVALTIVGYVSFPIVPSEFVRQMPFDGAYGWLNQHAKKGDVLLTAPQRRTYVDYAVLFTPLKIFIHPQAEVLAKSQFNVINNFRFQFYLYLLTGELTQIEFGKALKTREDMINYVKLDYVLVDRQTPFLPNIERNLKPFSEEVYRDDRAVLYRVHQKVK